MDREKLLMESDSSGRHKSKKGTAGPSQQVLHTGTGVEALQGGHPQEVLQRLQNIYGGTIRIHGRDIQEQPRTYSALALDTIHLHRAKR